MKIRVSIVTHGGNSIFWEDFSYHIDELKKKSMLCYLLALTVSNHGGSRTSGQWLVEDVSYNRGDNGHNNTV